MEFVSEEIIDQAVGLLEEEDYADQIVRLQQDQPHILAWLYSEDFDAFTRSEREYLLYLVLVIYRSIELVRGAIPPCDSEQISEAEEANWEALGETSQKGFHERLDVFFDHTDQEDLLAYAEDALSDFEDGIITKEGREALFVVLKTAVDLWAV